MWICSTGRYGGAGVGSDRGRQSSVWLEAWPRPTRPTHAVAKWLGRSLKAAAEHSSKTSERHFKDVMIRGGGVADAAETLAATPVEPAAECDAKFGATETRNATLQAPASGNAEPQKNAEPAATTGVAAGSRCVLRPAKAREGFSEVQNGRYRTRITPKSYGKNEGCRFRWRRIRRSSRNPPFLRSPGLRGLLEGLVAGNPCSRQRPPQESAR